MQNEGVHLASLTLGFRAHTRVLATLSVALLIALLAVSNPSLPSVPAAALLAVKTESPAELSQERPRAALPRTLIRFVFLLPHLIPHGR